MSGIKEDVEKRLYEFLGEVGDRIGAERVQNILETAITGAARTKKAVDKNVESLLSIANIPSRREYDRMRIKLDALQGSVVSLSRSVEELRDRFGVNGRSQAGPPNSAALKGVRGSTKTAAQKIAATRAKAAHAQAPKRSSKSSRSKRAR
jgi:hypothetical protein